jgi:HPr kinase/phosphorylase
MLTIEQLARDIKLEIVSGQDAIGTIVDNPQLSRPGIELAGLYDFYEHHRLQLFGSKEITFFGWLNSEQQKERVAKLFEASPPAFIFSKKASIPQLFIDMGNKYNIPVLKSEQRTSELASRLYQYLFTKLAPRTSVHGTLLDINGVGVLIRGESGIGKSEIALELVRRGHQLVADDRVDLYERDEGTIIGESPDVLKEHLEIRGIGIVNVVKMFGAGAFKEDKKVMLFIDLVKWDESVDYDRLGLDNAYETVFDTKIPVAKIPVTAARNVSTLVEAAAMNTRLQMLGTHMAQDFSDKINTLISNKTKKD